MRNPFPWVSRRYTPVALIIGLFLAIGALYIHINPIFEAPDEPAHYRYARYIVERRALPPLVISDDAWEQGEMHQPPLYYMLGALLVGDVGEDEVHTLYPRNVFAALGRPAIAGNKNAVLHIAPDAPAQQAMARSVRRLRSLSLGLSAITVLLTWLIARRIFPAHSYVALGAAALTAFNPQFLFISASVNNDLAVTMLSTLALYMALGVVTGVDHPTRTPLLLGAVVGLAALSKLSGLATAALVPVAYALSMWRRPPRHIWAGLLRPCLLAAAAALVTGGWWYLRNTLRYGDPLALNAYHSVFAGGDPLSIVETLEVALAALVSYWGVFGWFNVVADEWFYVLVRAITLLSVLGLALWAVRQRTTRGAERGRGMAMAALWAALVLGMNLYFVRSAGHTQGRLAFPAIGALSCLAAVGLIGWLPRRAGVAATALLALGMAAIAIAIPYAYIAPAYALPPRIAAADLPETVQRVDVHYVDDRGETLIILLGYEVLADKAHPGGALPLRLYWQARMPLPTSYALGIQLVNAQETRIGGLDTHPGMGLYPTPLWQPDEVLVDDYSVTVDGDAAVPTAASLRVGVYQGHYSNQLHARDPRGSDLPLAPNIARVRIVPRKPARYAPAHPMEVRLADPLTLTGYDLTLDADGHALDLTLYWECLAPTEHSYTMFAHLLDASDEVLTQSDNKPMDGGFPTTFWQTGDHVRDEHRLLLPPDLSSDTFRLRVGLYHTQTDDGLPVADDGPPEGSIILGPFRITDGDIVPLDAAP